MARGRTVCWSACMSADRWEREKWDCMRALAFVCGSVHFPFSTAMWACIRMRRTVSSSPARHSLTFMSCPTYVIIHDVLIARAASTL